VSAADVRGVVLSGTGGVWRVRTDGGDTVEASIRGRLKLRKQSSREAVNDGLKLAVGDHVLVDATPGACAIVEILPRHSKLARRAPGGGPGERVLAANLDQVVVVFAVMKPEPHLRMLDRFLVIAEANAIAARIVVNKVDLADESDARTLFADYERAGYPLHYTSVKAARGLDALHDALAGRVSAFTGPSGVGKSSLLNALYPGSNLRVGEISESVNKGRHTTVGALMIPLRDARGGYVVDTPGLREVGVADLVDVHLDACFPEFRPLLESCRFGDCRHVEEPDCAVLGAVKSGAISRPRYDSYVSLLAGDT
jgi:ribosome biogenesis GTPase